MRGQDIIPTADHSGHLRPPDPAGTHADAHRPETPNGRIGTAGSVPTEAVEPHDRYLSPGLPRGLTSKSLTSGSPNLCGGQRRCGNVVAVTPSRKPVFLLGAGFSKAVDPKMPLLDELGHLAREILDQQALLVALPPPRGNFETWLSRLAEDQPDLDEADNLFNRGLFIRASEALAVALGRRQREVPVAPDWLFRFVGLIHCLGASVITFNYDTLLERTIDRHQLWDWTTLGRVLSEHAIEDLPPAPPGGMFGVEQRRTFRLLKLHGSLNWWWSPGDTVGATINRWAVGAFGDPDDKYEEERRRRLPGRSRFIVPPTATKSSYYTNPFTKELWRRAAEGIAGSSHVYLVGYSLPATDIVASGMLSNSLPEDVPVTVVNPEGDAVIEQLVHLGISRDRLNCVPGHMAVESMVESLESQVARRLVERLRRELVSDLQPIDPAAPIAIGWGSALMAPVLDVSSGNGEALLRVQEPKNPYESLSVQPERPELPRVATLMKLLKGDHPEDGPARAADVDRVPIDTIWTVFHDGRRAKVIDFGKTEWSHGVSRNWLTLVPSLPPPGWDSGEL